MATSSLIVRHHPRRFTPPSPRDLGVRHLPRPGRGVSGLDCSFSFVFLNVQRSNLQTFQLPPTNSFPHNLLSDPHPLNPVVSIFYKTVGGGGHFSLLLNFLIFLLPNQKGSMHVP